MAEQSEIIGQQKIVFDRTDPRSLKDKELPKLRIVPVAKDKNKEKQKRVFKRRENTMYSGSRETDYDYVSMGFVGPKQDSAPDVVGDVNLEGGYLALETQQTLNKKQLMGSYVALETIFLTNGERIEMGDIFYALKSDIPKPLNLIKQIQSER